MSYPKKAPKAKTAAKEQEWEKQRDKASGIQKRDQLKSLLVNKFKTKYAVQLKDHRLEALLLDEVAKFISQSTLTEANLQKFDLHLGTLFHERSAKGSAVGAKAGAAATPHEAKTNPKEVASLAQAPADPTASPQKDNWACIVEYNRKLHDDEQKAALDKQKDMKTKLKAELDRQIEDKRKLQAAQQQKEKDLEARQVRMETDQQNRDRAKEQHQKELVLKQSLEARKISERIIPFV